MTILGGRAGNPHSGPEGRRSHQPDQDLKREDPSCVPHLPPGGGELARDIMDEQVRHGSLELVEEVSKLCQTMRLEGARTTSKSMGGLCKRGEDGL